MSLRASREAPAENATVVTSQKVCAGRADEYQRWQRRMNEAAREFDGFEGAEVYPPEAGDENEWVAVFRFAGVDYLTAWLDSGRRRELLDEGREFFEESPTQEVLRGGAPAEQAPEMVTAVVSHEVRPGREEGFLRWQERAFKAQAKSPGFMGSELFKPVEGVQEHWVVVFRFDSREHLDDWLASDVRQTLLEEGRTYFASYDVRKVGSAFSGWFRFGEGKQDNAPPNWKQAMTVLLALYPTVMVLNLTEGRWLDKLGVPGYIGLFIGNMLSVSALTWLLMPLVNKALAFWLVPSRATTYRVHLAGAAAVVLCYALFLIIFGLTTH
ncbi:antibiotic biosynthesis monooxygenase [Streptomyces sp. NBC_00841]|uniref:antibiotic biosynthesis monooxygenase n=1 Tax=Streptomyces sp. NBC_00841 TaxID=2975847 RepID=UPI002DD99F8F|nr:antibiotic biosynthesis monooxygenase [Streptomyces sp. NBC_00841]WSA00744.1 antibiotic biosynthesis monooxygenase [Streptomyces sp. NBC_00841]